MTPQLILKFDPNTIEHLGVSLYSKLPSVLSELVSNSWDADAEEVTIDFIDNGVVKEIYYRDDGHGMTFDELNEKYLLIGRNRRRDQEADKTPSGRKVMGKKGLGKLSVFGICNEVEIKTTKNGVTNCFLMEIEEIKRCRNSTYNPKIIAFNKSTGEKSGTEIWLRKVKRKSDFKIKEIALGLSKKFLIFDRLKTIITHNQKNEIHVTNELKFSDFKIEFTWDFPDKEIDVSYAHWSDVKGRILTLETPIKDTEMKGVYLTSRGKIVNVAGFYGLRDTDQFHTYVTGYLEVDFIDDYDEDLISTDRHSLNWEADETRELQAYLQSAIKKVGADWKKKRAKKKEKEISSSAGVHVYEWQAALPTYERELSEKIINPILENPALDVAESGAIIGNVIGKFNNEVFKTYASRIADVARPEDISTFIQLITEWKSIEAKQLSSLAISRIEVIKQFEKLLEEDTREVPTLHNFLKKFSWLLDPRILEFRDEVTYSKLLKETYPEESLDDKDRRIDFLCSNALGGILYVIEIKRSRYKIDAKALEQAYEYGAFLSSKYGTEHGFSKVVCFVVGGEKKSEDMLFSKKEATYRNSGEVFVKTYRELLEQSKQYHKEFLEAYSALYP